MDSAKSYESGKAFIRGWIYNNFDPDTTILDVGAGCGTYWWLLHNRYKNIDGVEIYDQNIIDYRLDSKYRKIFNKNIVELEYDKYNLIIFGDIIEHLTIEDAIKTLNHAIEHSDEVIVAVPYEKLSRFNENMFEIHIQTDLTPRIMKTRYKFLQPIWEDRWYGYYIKREENE